VKLTLPKQYSETVAYVTDDSRECNKESAFLLTPLSVKYTDSAKNTGAFISADELASYFDFSKIKIIGITGTNGKTTTAGAIYSMLLDLGYKVAMQGTRGFFINGKKCEGKSLTTPMQLGNFAHIQEAIDSECEFFIMEVSSHAIAQKRIEGLDFALKIFTNLTQDHLDFHKTFEDYKETKLSFLRSGTVLFNADDDASKELKGTSYALENCANYKISAFSENEGLWFVLESKDLKSDFASEMVGRFNLYNLSAAIGAIHMLTNTSFEDIAKVLENFGGVEGRMQCISNKPLVIVDFAHTPDGIARALEAVKHKDLIVVFGAGGDRDAGKRPLMGREVARRAKTAIVTSDNPRSEDPNLIIEQIIVGMQNYQGKLIVEPNRKKAIEIAIKLAKDSDAVMILGKGDETEQIIGNDRLEFDDRKIAKEILGQI
jgi:UDP-N-acetylmuramoyl-L-alanyl-D-glutamate--2,6-diaminopimelate ligase